jgi:hypothetical protein
LKPKVNPVELVGTEKDVPGEAVPNGENGFRGEDAMAEKDGGADFSTLALKLPNPRNVEVAANGTRSLFFPSGLEGNAIASEVCDEEELPKGFRNVVLKPSGFAFEQLIHFVLIKE